MGTLGPSFRFRGFPSGRFVRCRGRAAPLRDGGGCEAGVRRLRALHSAPARALRERRARTVRARPGRHRPSSRGPAEAAPPPPFCAVGAAGGAIGEAAAAGLSLLGGGSGSLAVRGRRARRCALRLGGTRQFGLFGSASLKVVTFTLGPRREHCDEIRRLRRGLVLGGRWKVKWLQNWVNSLVVCSVCSKVLVKADTWERSLLSGFGKHLSVNVNHWSVLLLQAPSLTFCYLGYACSLRNLIALSLWKTWFVSWPSWKRSGLLPSTPTPAFFASFPLKVWETFHCFPAGTGGWMQSSMKECVSFRFPVS